MWLTLQTEMQSGTTSWFRRHTWVLAGIVAFGVVYACALTFVYSDSDDAVSMAYHALGRDDAVQPPFERFQYGMDLLLAFLPAHEPTLRIVGMVVTATASVVLALLMLMLAFVHAADQSGKSRVVVTLAFLLSAPELFFLGLLYTPMLVGMCLAVSAHVMLRKTSLPEGGIRNVWQQKWPVLVGSGILMGAAGLFRWDIMAYAAIVALDLILVPPTKRTEDTTSFVSRGTTVLGWGAFACCVWLFLVVITGDLSKALEDTLPAIKETHGEVPFWQTQFLGAHLPLFTPGFLMFVVTGLIGGLKQKEGARVFFVISLLLLAIWPFQSTPKEILLFVPLLVLLFTRGCIRCMGWNLPAGFRAPLLVTVLVILLLPWVWGVQVLHGDSSWGPGFELRPFFHPVSDGTMNMHIVPAAGAACPTNEGLRPVFGYGWVLLGGGWRSLANQQDSELTLATETALKRNLPYLIIREADGFQVTTAVRMGFMTKDPELKTRQAVPVVRVFVNSRGEKLTFIRFHYDELVKTPENVQLTIRTAGCGKVLVWGEAGYMRLLYRLAPDALEPIGLQTAILDLHELHRVVENRSLGSISVSPPQNSRMAGEPLCLARCDGSYTADAEDCIVVCSQ